MSKLSVCMWHMDARLSVRYHKSSLILKNEITLQIHVHGAEVLSLSKMSEKVMNAHLCLKQR